MISSLFVIGKLKYYIGTSLYITITEYYVKYVTTNWHTMWENEINCVVQTGETTGGKLVHNI